MFSVRKFRIVFFLWFGISGILCSARANENISPEMIERFEKLERQTVAMREELNRLQATSAMPVPKTEPTTETKAVLTAEPTAVLATETKTDEGINQESQAWIEQKIRENAWKKGDSWIRPYGILWASLLGGDARFLPNDAVQRVLPGQPEDVCTVTARRSRFGAMVHAPDLSWGTCGCPMKMSGRVEIDFMGELGTAENKPGVLLRHAYWNVENQYAGFLFGQTEDVVSPLAPNSLNYYNLWFAGNIGYRNPQARFSRYFYPTARTRMEAVVALCQITGSDFSANDQTASWPTIQARLGWKIQRNCPSLEAIQFGVSGHVGEQQYLFDSTEYAITTWSANVDLRIPLTHRMGIQGEFFHGQGLSGFGGGIDQSFDYARGSGGGSHKSIHSTGGWVEMWLDLTCQTRWTFGGGIDDPCDSEMEAASVVQNSSLYTNIVYRITPFLRTGLEYSYWQTLYAEGTAGGSKGSASVVEWMWQFEF